MIAAAGGHHDSADNRVVSLVLSADSPTWVMRSASSANPVENVEYYPDGLPSSRHLYHSSHIIESRHRVFLFGARGVWGDGYDYSTVVDAFDLDTNTWDPAGTWDRIPSAGGYGAVHVRATDDVFTTGLFQWSAATASWSQPITQFSGDNVRWPIAYDSLRNQLFSLQWADGQGFGDMKINASKVPLPGPTQLTVSFNPSPALTQFQADAPTYSGLDYDPDNDRFLFYCGQAGGEGRVYVVTPNATSTWDMSILPLDPGSVKPPTVTGSGVYSRFRYVPQLKGFLLLPDNTNNIFFLRTC